jgi:hypothetical protein
MPDDAFVCVPIWLSEFQESYCCGTSGVTGLDETTLVKSGGSDTGWDDDDPEFSWVFGRESASVVWNRTIQLGICCHRDLEIDVHYKAFESDSFDGVFTIKVEDADGVRTLFDAATAAIPGEGEELDVEIVTTVQPRACGIILTIIGEITVLTNTGGEPNEGTFWIDRVEIDPPV